MYDSFPSECFIRTCSLLFRYLLRRAAARTIVQQSSRQLPIIRSVPVSRIAVFQSSKPAFCRFFHQSRIWRAEEDEKKSELVKEQGVAAAELAEDSAPVAEDTATTNAAPETPVQEVGELVGSESSTADAAETAAAAAAAASSSTGPPEPRQPSSGPRSANSRGDIPPGRILYVGNLFFEVTTSELEAEFGRYGTITNSRIVTDARGQSKGFGYIEFSEQSAAEQAIRQLDQKVFQGRRMAVQYHIRRDRATRDRAQTPAINAPSKTLFIGNMSYQMSDRDLNGMIRYQ